MAIIPENPQAGSIPAATGNRHAPYRIAREIIGLSNAKDWREAKAEWQLVKVWLEPHGVCLCGHSITEHCLLINHLNCNEALVGNCCIKRFLDIPSEPIFAGLRRIARNPGAALNEEVIAHARERGWINEWERGFYLDTIRKRKLTERQRAKRVEINSRVLALVGGKSVADA